MDAEFASLLQVLARTGIDESRITRFAEPAPTAQLTAEALGTDAAHVVNSLVFNADGEPLLVLASGGHRVSTRKISAALGVQKLRRASPGFVTAHTGQDIGGVGPIGHPKPIRTVIDLSLSTLGAVWVGAGTHDSVFETDFTELVTLTRGLPLDIAD